MKPVVTLIRAERGQTFHLEDEAVRRRTRCGRTIPSDGFHRERGVDADVIRLSRYPVCAECRRLRAGDVQRAGAGAGAPTLF